MLGLAQHKASVRVALHPSTWAHFSSEKPVAVSESHRQVGEVEQLAASAEARYASGLTLGGKFNLLTWFIWWSCALTHDHLRAASQRSLHFRTNLSPFTKGCRELWARLCELSKFLQGLGPTPITSAARQRRPSLSLESRYGRSNHVYGVCIYLWTACSRLILSSERRLYSNRISSIGDS